MAKQEEAQIELTQAEPKKDSMPQAANAIGRARLS